MAMFFAIIVIYDAAGVRMETGREAEVLNRLAERDQTEGKQPLNEKPLREKMGHTIPEIIVGMVLGGTVAAITCILMQKLI